MYQCACYTKNMIEKHQINKTFALNVLDKNLIPPGREQIPGSLFLLKKL